MLSEFSCCDCCGESGTVTAVVVWWVAAEDCRTGVLLKSQRQRLYHPKAFSAESLQQTHKERERHRGVFSKRPLSGGTYSGACTQPCSTPLSRNCCGCRRSPRIWSAHTSSGSCRSASGASRHGRGRSQPPGCTPLPGDSLLDHPATRGSTYFQGQIQTLSKLPSHTPYYCYIYKMIKENKKLGQLLSAHDEQTLSAAGQDDLSSCSDKAEQHITVSAVSWEKGDLLMRTLIWLQSVWNFTYSQ